VAERVQNKFVELAIRLGKPSEACGDGRRRRAIISARSRPSRSARLSHALIQSRMAQGDNAGASTNTALQRC
jgi:hypothetical protein